MAARYPHCALLMWLQGVVRRRYVAAMVRREEESGRVIGGTDMSEMEIAKISNN